MPAVRHLSLRVLALIGVAGLLAYGATHLYGEYAAIRHFAESTEDPHISFSAHAYNYRMLLEKIGPQAQTELLHILPSTPRSHMINHESGFYLFDRYGAAGLDYCKNYFNGGCYHGFVEAALAERGFGALDDIVTACRKERPLKEARECTHGVGHAILIARGYEHLDEAAQECHTTFQNNDAAIEDCLDGVFMENGFGGFDIPPENRWFKSDDPLYPCTHPSMRTEPLTRKSCLFLQTQGTLNEAKYPQLQGDIAKVVEYCNTLSEPVEREYCFLGLARQIQARFVEDEEAIRTACAVFPPERTSRCVAHAAESAYAFGSRNTAVSLCRASGVSEDCFHALYLRIGSTGEHTSEGRRAACRALPDEYVHSCLETVGL